MREPTRGQRRIMIYKHVRTVATACDGCGLSIIACSAEVEYQGRRCCELCAHSVEDSTS